MILTKRSHDRAFAERFEKSTELERLTENVENDGEALPSGELTCHYVGEGGSY